jgi:succinoglycan biosynthesis protein ExoA
VTGPPAVRSGDAEHEGEEDLVTVVVPARDEEAFIGACLDSILASHHRNLQVLVVDGDSEDRTAEIVLARAALDPRVSVVENPDRLIPIGLNRALEAAEGEWLVRVDAHATIPPDYVGRAVTHLRDGGWGAVGGRKDGVGTTPAGRAVAAAMASRFGVGGSTYHHGTEPREVDHVPFGAYPVALARRLGGWDERLAVNQDFEFDRRIREAGHRILFDPALRIDWHCRQRVADLFRQYRRYGRGKVTVMALHPASTRLRHLAAPALVLGLAASALTGLATRRSRAAAAVVPYAAAVALATATTAGRTPAGSRRWLAPSFVAMHVGWGIGFWEGVARLLAGHGPINLGRGGAQPEPWPSPGTAGDRGSAGPA